MLSTTGRQIWSGLVAKYKPNNNWSKPYLYKSPASTSFVGIADRPVRTRKICVKNSPIKKWWYVKIN